MKSSIPVHSGRKENEKRQRKRTNNELRDVFSGSASADQASGTDQRTDDLEIVFICDTAAYKWSNGCNGCNGAVQSKLSEDPPLAPYNIFLQRKEYRVYRQRGTTKMCVTKNKEL